MRGIKAIVFGCAAALTLSSSIAHAITMTTTNTGDEIDWGQFGSVGTSVAEGSTYTTDQGISGTISFHNGSPGPGEILEQGNGWNGNFNPNQSVLYTEDSGPVTLFFLTPEQSFTEAIQANFFGVFDANILAFNGATLLGSFDEIGNSEPGPAGTATFLGVTDSSADITSVTYTIESCALSCNEFALAGSTFSSTVPVPEPGSLALLASAVIGFGAIRRRRKTL